jgi:Ca2+-binding RTX toxin-like protein
MTLTIKQLTNYSWMSQASYLDFTGVLNGATGLALDGKLTNKDSINAHNIFAADQAGLFTGSATPSNSTDGFSFVSYAPNYQDTGFSATVFKSNADNSYTIAVRGTEPESLINSEDLFNADVLGVVLQGKALEQLFVGYRYYKQLTAIGSTVSYSQQELTAMANLLVTAHDKNVNTALFLISPIASVISTWVSGLTFAERVQSMTTTLQSVLGNDPSIGAGAIPAGATINFTGHSLGGHVAALLAEMVAQYGNSTIGDIATYNAPGINALSYEIENWLTVGTATTQTGVLANRVAVVGDGGVDVTAGLGLTNGIVQKTFIETSSDPISNHSIVKLFDSLAVKDIFAMLDPATSIQELDNIIEQSSNTLADSLEKTLDALRKTILGNSITSTVVSGSEEAAARDSYYLHIQELTDIDTLLNVENILGSSYNDHLTGNAANNRFQSMGGNDVIDGGDGAFDLIEFTNVFAAVNVNMSDWSIQSTNMQRIGTLTLSNIEGVSGSIYNDTLTGTSGANYLNGYAGRDVINGGAGDDYLAGGSSTDTLTGGEGKDTFMLGSDRGLGIQNGVDTITDFNLTDDSFRLISADFTAFIGVAGTLASNNFVAGADKTTASDADDYIIYNSTNGNVFYDADGSDSAYNPILIADVTDGLTLTHSHFTVGDSVFIV